MCGCNAKGKTVQTTYTVTYPDGSTEVKTSAGAAQIAASKVPGATYARTQAQAAA